MRGFTIPTIFVIISTQNMCDMKHAINRLQVIIYKKKKGKRKVQGVPQSQTAALPRPQEEEKTDKSKQAQIEQTYEKH